MRATVDTFASYSHGVDKPGQQLRAIFISDIHLVTGGCQAEMLLEFMRQTDRCYGCIPP
jgi:hypothetical protein